jgi:hypothetical protein
MPSHTYKLGKDATFSGPGISNDDVKSVTITKETAAEADVTTRASGSEKEFAFVRSQTNIEVVVLNHSATQGATGSVTVTNGFLSAGGVYQVMSISEPQELDGAIESTITLRKTPGGSTGA